MAQARWAAQDHVPIIDAHHMKLLNLIADGDRQ
jgi:hypothetical protein